MTKINTTIPVLPEGSEFSDPELNPFVTGYRDDITGKQVKFTFPNNFGASVICNEYSYGHQEGLFEIVVLDKNGSIFYDTSITDDVIGNLTAGEALVILREIKALPTE